MLQLTGLSALSSLLAPGAGLASDSGNSSADSGNSSAGSGDSSAGSSNASGGSANASGGSAEASAGSANSSDSGESSAASSNESANDSEGLVAITLVILSTATTAGAIVLIVALARGGKNRQPNAPPRTDAALLLESGLLNARRELGLQLASLARNPAALDRLAAQAWAGDGPELAALARSAGLSRARVAGAVRETWRAPRSAEEAARVLVALLADLAPDLRADPGFVAEMLWRLELERRRGSPADQPTHRALARWMGVERDDYAPHIALALAGVPSRAALYAKPTRYADALADALAAAFPEPVRRRIDLLCREVSGLDWSLAGGLPEQAPA